MIGDIYDMKEEGVCLLAEITETSYKFLTIEVDNWPREFYTPRNDKPKKTALMYSIMGCNHSENKERDFAKDDIIYVFGNGKITPYKFLNNFNANRLNHCRLINKRGATSNHLWGVTMSFKHKFKRIEGTNAERCEDCGCLLTQQYKPSHKLSFQKRHTKKFSLQQL